MSKINQPYDFLELEEFVILKNVLNTGFRPPINEHRPMEQFERIAKMFGRDFLRNYLFKKYNGAKSHMDIENEIREFELEIYGTSQ